jgi:superfamily II DNA or RNA helicase
MLTLTIRSTFSTLQGLPWGSAEETHLQKVLGYLIPNAENNFQVKQGLWDGWVTLLQRDRTQLHHHTLPTGLVPRLYQLCADAQLPLQAQHSVPAFEGHHANAHPDYWPKALTSTLRPYQHAALSALCQGIPLANGVVLPRLGGVLQVCTGGGKSLMATHLIAHLRQPAVVLVNSGDLFEQIKDTLHEELGAPIGEVGASRCRVEPVTVAMLQTLHQFYAARQHGAPHKHEAALTQLVAQARTIVVDECHGVAARTAFEATGLFEQANAVVGLSASPWRDDGLDTLITAAVGPVVAQVTATELIELGYLVRPTIHIHELRAPAGAPTYGEYDVIYDQYITSNAARNDHIADLATQHAGAGETVLVLVKLEEHGQALADRIPGSVFVCAKRMGKRARKALWEQLRSRAVSVVIATTLADQGLDIPDLNTLILAGGGKSSTRALQRVGRVLRKPAGSSKTHATVHEFVDPHPMLKKHFQARMRIYATEPAFRYERHPGPASRQPPTAAS